jgi:hypothetical protein
MTVAMNELHRKLPRRERYPLPPREIVDSVASKAGLPIGAETAIDAATASHFAYGAACGAIIGASSVRVGPVTGAIAGAGVWAASYFGWIPGAGILKPAHLHPKRRNLLMIAAHLVWGAATARAMAELAEARETILATGEGKDAL